MRDANHRFYMCPMADVIFDERLSGIGEFRNGLGGAIEHVLSGDQYTFTVIALNEANTKKN